MTQEVLDIQGKIHELFSAMKTLDDVEWVDSISDDHYPNVCPICDGFEEYRYSNDNVGHQEGCRLVESKRSLFRQAVELADQIPDGNLFLNLVTALYLGSPQPKFG